LNSPSRTPVLALLPGGLLLLATALLLNFASLPPSSYARVQFGFYIVLCAGFYWLGASAPPAFCSHCWSSCW
jgi:hypothetical protein